MKKRNTQGRLNLENLEDRTTPAAIPFVATDIATNVTTAEEVIAVDLDRDGAVDLVSASRGDNTIRWFRNSGFGTFTPQTIDTNALGTQGVAAGDADGDGDIDLFATALTGNAVYFYENNGSQSFTRRTIDNAAQGALDIQFADIDADGKGDLVVALSGEAQFVWYRNVGGANVFASLGILIGNGNGARDLRVFDADGDGDLDVAGVAANDQKLYLYTNNGNQVFTRTDIESNATFGATIREIDIVDLDGDGDLDILAAVQNADRISWYENNSKGSFTRQTVNAGAMDGPQSVRGVDLDGDGDIDVLAASQNDDRIAWFENDGNQSFTFRTIATDADSAQSVVAADVDRDGDWDVVSASANDNSISLYRNTSIHGSAVYPIATAVTTSLQNPRSIATGDLNRNGSPDVVVGSFVDNTIRWYANNGQGGLVEQAQAVSTAATQVNAVGLYDVNQDGLLDVYAALGNRIAWYQNNGNGTFTEQLVGAISGGLSIDTGDYNRDGYIDFLAVETVTGNLKLFQSTGLATWKAADTPAALSSTVARFADMNRDGFLDLLFNDGVNNRVSFLEQTVGGFNFRVVGNASDVQDLQVGDVGRDGDLDVFAASFAGDVGYVYINDGSQSFTRQTAIPSADGLNTLATSDADRDGDLDLFGGAFNTGKLYFSQYSDPAFFSELLPVTLAGINDVGVADLNQDGKPDLIVAAGNQGTTTPQLQVLLNRGGQYALPTTNVNPSQITEGESAALHRFELIHRGRFGDSDIELSSLLFFVNNGTGVPLSNTQYQNLFSQLSIVRDTNGNGAYDPGTDSKVSLATTPSFNNGSLTFTFNAADPTVTVDAPGTPNGTTQRTYFLVAQLTANASSQTPNTFIVTHQTDASTARDASAGIPVSWEFGTPSSTGPVTAAGNAPPEVVSLTSSTPNAVYGVGSSISVTVTFSEPVTLAGGNLRLNLDTGGVVSLSPFSNQTSVSGGYTVASGQQSSDLNVTSIVLDIGATLRDSNLNNAILTLPTGNQLADNADIVVDGVAPNTPSVTTFSDDTGSPGDGITADQTLLVGGTAEPNAAIEVFRNGTSQGTTTANNSGNWSYSDPSTLSDGVTYNYTAVARDAAGNSSSPSTPLTVTIDATAPNAPTVSGISDDTGTPGDGITADQTLTVAGTAESNALVELFRDGVSIGTTTSSQGGNWSLTDATTLTAGSYQYTATARDVAGNTSSASTPFNVEIVLPPLTTTISGIQDDTGVSSSDGITRDQTLTIQGVTESGAAVELFRNGVSIGTTTATNSGSWNLSDASTLTNGQYTYTAQAKLNNVTGNLSQPFVVTVDTVAPSRPTITSIQSDTGIPGDGVTTDGTLLINGSAEPSARVELFLDGTPLGSTTATSTGSWQYDNTASTLADGTYRLTAIATDLAGNSSLSSETFTVVVNTTGAPVVTGISEDTGSSPSDGITRDTTLQVRGTAQPNVSVEVFRNGTLRGSTTSTTQGAWSFTDGTTLQEGTYNYTARAVALSGQPVLSEAFTVIVDTTAPVVTVNSLTTSSTSPELSGTIDSETATVQVEVNGETYSAINNGDGTWTLPAGEISPALTPGTYSLEVSSTDAAGNTSSNSETSALRITSGTSSDTPVGQSSTGLFAVGAGPGGSTSVRVYNPDGTSAYTVTPFSKSESPGGVRTALADMNGDGVPDLVVGAGPGGPPVVKIIDGQTKEELFSFNAFEASFLGGVYVAAGDLDGDGKADLVVSPDQGGGPRIRIFSGASGDQINDFFGIEDTNFRGGARVSLADVNGDGRTDLIVAAGFGGGPRIAIFDGTSVASGSKQPEKLTADFFAFEQSLRNGTFISSGDVDGDGKAEIIAGGGPGGGPRVLILSATELLNGNSSGAIANPLGNFFAGDVDNRGGVRVVVKDLDNDSKADLLVGAGDGAGSRVTAYLGSSITRNGTPSSQLEFDAFPGFDNGVFVG